MTAVTCFVTIVVGGVVVGIGVGEEGTIWTLDNPLGETVCLARCAGAEAGPIVVP